MTPPVLYLPYNTSFHERTGDILTFAHFVEGSLVENERNAEIDISISASTDDSSTHNDSDDGFISMKSHEDIWYGSQIHPELKRC